MVWRPKNGCPRSLSKSHFLHHVSQTPGDDSGDVNTHCHCFAFDSILRCKVLCGGPAAFAYFALSAADSPSRVSSRLEPCARRACAICAPCGGPGLSRVLTARDSPSVASVNATCTKLCQPLCHTRVSMDFMIICSTGVLHCINPLTCHLSVQPA